MNSDNITKYLYELGQLKHLKRSGWWVAGIKDPETVAEHSFRTAILGYILAQLEGADPLRTTAMCLFHDTQEARLNDLHWIGANYVEIKDAEKKAFLDQIGNLPINIKESLDFLMTDFVQGETLEAQIVRDADRLECLIQAREYQAQGFNDVETWISNCKAGLQTGSAKELAESCLRVDPKEWWQGLNEMASNDE